VLRYDVRSSTCRTVAAYHCAPPWAVGTPSRFRLSAAIARSDSPRACCRWIRRTTFAGSVGGRPSLIPLAFLITSASPCSLRDQPPLELTEQGR